VKETVRLFKALGDPTRLRILKLLERGELCVCQLTAALDMGQSRISRHLSILRNCGLIEDRRAGKWVHYRLCCRDATKHIRACLAELGGDRIVRLDHQAVMKTKPLGPCLTKRPTNVRKRYKT